MNLNTLELNRRFDKLKALSRSKGRVRRVHRGNDNLLALNTVSFSFMLFVFFAGGLELVETVVKNKMTNLFNLLSNSCPFVSIRLLAMSLSNGGSKSRALAPKR